jgi:hypothetical protein
VSLIEQIAVNEAMQGWTNESLAEARELAERYLVLATRHPDGEHELKPDAVCDVPAGDLRKLARAAWAGAELLRAASKP